MGLSDRAGSEPHAPVPTQVAPLRAWLCLCATGPGGSEGQKTGRPDAPRGESQARSFLGPLGDCPAPDSLQGGTYQAESCWAGLGRAAGPGKPDTDPLWKGSPVGEGQAVPMVKKGLRIQAEGQRHPPALYFYLCQKVTKNPNFGLPPICLVTPGQRSSRGLSFPIRWL